MGAVAALYGGTVAGLSWVSPLAASIVGGVGAVGVVGASAAISSTITNPMRDLGRQIRRFGDGDFGARAAPATDEVGTLARSFNTVADSLGTQLADLEVRAASAGRLRSIGDALEMADDEAQVYRILERAVGLLAPSTPVDLLVGDNRSRLKRVAVNPVAGQAGCPVAGTDGCVAMRRAQTMTFASPDDIDACPRLADHEAPCSATCIPVGVHGHLLGVLHLTGREGDAPRDEIVSQLGSISALVGGRVGAIRALESSRLEASTDGLTGLANRRKLEAAAEDLLNEGIPFSLVMADIDHFKKLNDRYGHEVGDRALQLFAGVLQDNVRGQDVVARFGGEEFVLIYPRLPAPRAIEVLDRIRQALAEATEAAGLPAFTTSFGVASSTVAESLDDIIRVADAGLFSAKEAGRNRVVFADHALAEQMFSAKRAGLGDVIDLTSTTERDVEEPSSHNDDR